MGCAPATAMTTDVVGAAPTGSGLWRLMVRGRALPLAVVITAIGVIWYAGAVYMNAPRLIDGYDRQKVEWTFGQLVDDAWSMERPILPAPHQIVAELDKSVLQRKVTSKRSLVFHAWVTLSSTVLGFVMGTALGIGLAVAMVHVRTLDRSLMPWIIAPST